MAVYDTVSAYAHSAIGKFDFQPVQRNGTEAVVCNHGDTAIVSFAGTNPDTLIDVLNDAKFLFPRWSRFGRVSRGFKRAYKAVDRQVFEILYSLKPKHVFCTGHSLGGAVATLLAEDLLCSDLQASVSLVTFGSPAVGTEQFALGMNAAIEDRTWRFVNGADVVARCPPRGYLLLPRYRHVGRKPYLLTSDGQLFEQADADIKAGITLQAFVGAGHSLLSNHNKYEYRDLIADWEASRIRYGLPTLINHQVA